MYLCAVASLRFGCVYLFVHIYYMYILLSLVSGVTDIIVRHCFVGFYMI